MYTYHTGRTIEQVYDSLHLEPGYGDTNHGGGSEHLCDGMTSLLDVGAGCSCYARAVRLAHGLKDVAACDVSGVAVKYQQARGIQARRCDLSDCLPYADNEFEVVSCFDVLEHIPPGHVDNAITELVRVASMRVILSIATFECKGREEQLHLSVHPMCWWMDRLNMLSGGDVRELELDRPAMHAKQGKFKVVVVDL